MFGILVCSKHLKKNMSSLIEGLDQRTQKLENIVAQLQTRIESLEQKANNKEVLGLVETATTESVKKSSSRSVKQDIVE